MTRNPLSVVSVLVLLSAGAASAHATLEEREVAQGSTSTFTVRVGHGCEGEATLKVRVAIPTGLIAVKPMPKADWKLETVVAPYAKPYQYFETTLTEGVQEIIWTGDLPDAWYDEFVFRGRVSEDVPVGNTMYVPIVQECASGNHRWIEIPVGGQSADDLESPAPGVVILPASASY